LLLIGAEQSAPTDMLYGYAEGNSGGKLFLSPRPRCDTLWVI
jgi:hypothetical protein